MKINENSTIYKMTASTMPADGLHTLGCICEFMDNVLCCCAPDGSPELSENGRAGLVTIIRLVRDGLMEVAEAV